MNTKTILIILSTVLITVFLMINNDAVEFDFLIVKIEISKLIVIGVCTLLGFILGILVAKPKKVAKTYDPQIEVVNKDALSEEDRDYIS